MEILVFLTHYHDNRESPLPILGVHTWEVVMRTGKVHGPLAVVVAFLSIAEVALGTAATLTDGGVRWLFAVFAVLFPVYIAVQFFWILCKKNPVLYPPADFGTPIVGDYVDAMARVSLPPNYDVLEMPIEKGVREVVAAIGSKSAGLSVSEEEVEHYSEMIMSSLRNLQYVAIQVDPSFDARPIGRKGTTYYDVKARTWLVPYDPERQFDDFLHDIHRNLGSHPSIDVEGYGTRWCLQVQETGAPVIRKPRLTTLVAQGVAFDSNRDMRTLQTAGIAAAMLLVIRDTSSIPK